MFLRLYQLLIENKTFTSTEIQQIGSEFKNKLGNIDMDAIIDSIPYEIKSGHQEQDIKLLKKFVERNKNEFDDIMEEIIKHLVR